MRRFGKLHLAVSTTISRVSSNLLKHLNWKKINTGIDNKVKENLKYRRLVIEEDLISDDDCDGDDGDDIKSIGFLSNSGKVFLILDDIAYTTNSFLRG